MFSFGRRGGKWPRCAVVYPDCNRSRHAFNGMLLLRLLQKVLHTPLCVVCCSGEHSGVTKCFIISLRRRACQIQVRGADDGGGFSERGVSTDDYTWVGT